MAYEADVEKILARRHDNGADFWATPDGRIGTGGPFSTVEALLILGDLQVPKDHEAIQGAAALVLGACREDGRVRPGPKGTAYPCGTAIAAAALCRNGYAGDDRVRSMRQWLYDNRHTDGGWRCNKYPFGHGPDMDCSNPGVTLWALDAFRYTDLPASGELDMAVETLLDHWTVRRPLGPCQFGIGTLFLQVEFPRLRYNLLNYVHVLSHYPTARQDPRFMAAFSVLRTKLDAEGNLVVERPNRKLAGLACCQKGVPSVPATACWREIVQHLTP